MYSSPFRPQFRPKSVPRKVFPAAEDFQITYLKQQSWAMQKEMIWFLWEKWGIHVHRFTIFRILKKRHWSEKKRQRVDIRQNDELRLNWIADLLQLMTEQLVFVDETLFNETTKWCHQVYASVDEPARYQVSRKREHIWSVLSAYTIDDYLPFLYRYSWRLIQRRGFLSIASRWIATSMQFLFGSEECNHHE